jgi:hypothetical protein
MAKKRKKKNQKDKDNPVISETPVIDGEQATAPIPGEVAKDLNAIADILDPPVQHEAMTLDIPAAPRPEVEAEPEPLPITDPVICAGCKSIVDISTTRACLSCPRNMVFCPNCAKPGTCHKCGKGLSK